MRKIIWSCVLWLLCHSTYPPIDMNATHDNKHKEDIIKLLKDIMPISNATLIEHYSINNNVGSSCPSTFMSFQRQLCQLCQRMTSAMIFIKYATFVNDFVCFAFLFCL